MRKILLVASLLLFGESLLLAQSEPTIRLSEITAETSLLDLAAWRATTYGSSPTDTLDGRTFRFPAPERGLVGRDSVQWLRFNVLNDLPDPQRRIFQSSYQNDAAVFYFSNDDFKSWTHRRIGAFVPYHEADYRFDNCRFSVDLTAGQQLSFLVKLENRYYPQSNANIWFQAERGLREGFLVDIFQKFQRRVPQRPHSWVSVGYFLICGILVRHHARLALPLLRAVPGRRSVVFFYQNRLTFFCRLLGRGFSESVRSSSTNPSRCSTQRCILDSAWAC